MALNKFLTSTTGAVKVNVINPVLGVSDSSAISLLAAYSDPHGIVARAAGQYVNLIGFRDVVPLWADSGDGFQGTAVGNGWPANVVVPWATGFGTDVIVTSNDATDGDGLNGARKARIRGPKASGAANVQTKEMVASAWAQFGQGVLGVNSASVVDVGITGTNAALVTIDVWPDTTHAAIAPGEGTAYGCGHYVGDFPWYPLNIAGFASAECVLLVEYSKPSTDSTFRVTGTYFKCTLNGSFNIDISSLIRLDEGVFVRYSAWSTDSLNLASLAVTISGYEA